MTHTDPIKALIDLEPELQISLKIAEAKNTAAIIPRELRTILAAIEALKPLADGTHVVVGSVFLNDLRAIADTGGRRIETAMDACDKIVELIDMEARLGPAASPAPVDDGERVRAAKIEAFDEALSIAEGSYSYGEQQNEIIAGIRAALAAINGENEHGK